MQRLWPVPWKEPYEGPQYLFSYTMGEFQGNRREANDPNGRWVPWRCRTENRIKETAVRGIRVSRPPQQAHVSHPIHARKPVMRVYVA
jgi:hypothetical protein